MILWWVLLFLLILLGVHHTSKYGWKMFYLVLKMIISLYFWSIIYVLIKIQDLPIWMENLREVSGEWQTKFSEIFSFINQTIVEL